MIAVFRFALLTMTIEALSLEWSERKSHKSLMEISIGEWIGSEIRDARREKGMSQARLKSRARVTRETIYRLEKGRMATPDVLARVCDELQIDRDRFDLKVPETDGLANHPELTLLRDRRRAVGLTLAECAAAASVSVATLSRFERGIERSRVLALRNSIGHPVSLLSQGLCDALGFRDLGHMNRYWQTGRF